MTEPRKTLTGWPTKVQYLAAVQNSPAAFSDLRLQRARLTRQDNGLPAAVTGQHAVVFRLVQPNGRSLALRCLSHVLTDGARRYRLLPAHLERHPCPVLVPAEWIQDGILIDDEWWPVILMPWSPGDPLDLVVGSRLSAPAELRKLAERWFDAVGQLRTSMLAHGDLQHANVLIDPQLRISLIDLDSAWLPEGQPWGAGEAGHPNYRHPRRAAGLQGLAIDAFPASVIYVSLLALAADPGLWSLNDGDNLIFTRADFLQPGRTRIWKRLRRSSDPLVRSMTARLAEDCERAPEDSRAPGQLVAGLPVPR
jgi:hypothetical protein